MGDPYATIDQATDDVRNAIASAMEIRSLEPAHIRMRRKYLADVDLPNGAKALTLRASPPTGEAPNRCRHLRVA